MKFAIAMLVLMAAAVPASEAKTQAAVCRSQVSSQYKACLKRSPTKKGKHQCSLDYTAARKTCKK